jgi:hypothetical protein
MMPPVAPAEAWAGEGTASPITGSADLVRPARPSSPRLAQPGPLRASAGSRLDPPPWSAIEPEAAPPVLEVSEPAGPPVPGVSEPSGSAVVQTSPLSMPSLRPASEPSALTSQPRAAASSQQPMSESLRPAPPQAPHPDPSAQGGRETKASPEADRYGPGETISGSEADRYGPAETTDGPEADRYRPGISVVRRDVLGRFGAGMIGPRTAARPRVEPRRSDQPPSDAVPGVDSVVRPPVSEARPSQRVPTVLSDVVPSESPQHPWHPPTPTFPHKGGGRLTPGAGPTIAPPAAIAIVPAFAAAPPSSLTAPGQNGKRAPADRASGSTAPEGAGPSRLTARPPPGPAGMASPTAKSVLTPARATITIGRMDVQVVNRPQRAARDGGQVETPQFQRKAVDPGTLDRFRLLP